MHLCIKTENLAHHRDSSFVMEQRAYMLISMIFNPVRILWLRKLNETEEIG